MKIHIYLVANNYKDDGWELELVQDSNKWQLDYYASRPEVIHLQTIEITAPTDAQIITIAEHKIREMKEEVVDQTERAKEKIKDYEAKFLLIKAEELS